MEGGRERLSHYNTDFPHTHTHTLSLTIITAHMSLQKEMGSRGFEPQCIDHFGS